MKWTGFILIIFGLVFWFISGTTSDLGKPWLPAIYGGIWPTVFLALAGLGILLFLWGLIRRR